MEPSRIAAWASRNPAGFLDLPPLGAFADLRGFHVVDVREPEEFVGALGHLDGAELVPLGSLAARARAWATSQPILLVCRSGARSAAAAAALVRMGFVHVYNLAGGMIVWNENRLPVVR